MNSQKDYVPVIRPNLFDCASSELSHSGFLLWLFKKAKESDNFERRWLEALFKQLEIPEKPEFSASWWENAEPEKEQPLGKSGRIDLLVEGPGYLIGIENKIRAHEGYRQTARYLKELEKMSDKHCLLYFRLGGLTDPHSYKALLSGHSSSTQVVDQRAFWAAAIEAEAPVASNKYAPEPVTAHYLQWLRTQASRAAEVLEGLDKQEILAEREELQELYHCIFTRLLANSATLEERVKSIARDASGGSSIYTDIDLMEPNSLRRLKTTGRRQMRWLFVKLRAMDRVFRIEFHMYGNRSREKHAKGCDDKPEFREEWRKAHRSSVCKFVESCYSNSIEHSVRGAEFGMGKKTFRSKDHMVCHVSIPADEVVQQDVGDLAAVIGTFVVQLEQRLWEYRQEREEFLPGALEEKAAN